ncbi:TonB-dependent receptor domain-containing protein [Pseudoxanthomonas mexicana]
MKQRNRNTFHPNRKLLSCALASCLAMVTPHVMAQSTSATLRGVATADATVTVTNVDTGLTRSAKAANGSYSIGGLPPGTYRIEVNAGGQTSSRAVTLAVGQTATLNLQEAPPVSAPTGDATTLDTVRVTAPMLVETKTSEVATYVSQKQIEMLPQNSRNFLAFADTVPGITVTRSGVDETTSLRSGAQISNGINVFIDGVGQKDYVLKGGVTGQDSTAGNPFPQSAVGEYKVITSNYKAEYDQLSSAAITAVTKSGTNEFKGNFFWDYTNADWTARTPRQRLGRDAVTKRTAEQYGASLGGPIIEDMLHFFVTYEGKDIIRPRSVTPGPSNRNVPIEALPPAVQELARNTTGSPFNEELWFGKLSWTPGDAHLVEFTVKDRKEDDLVNIGGMNTASYATSRTGSDKRFDLRYQYSAENWLNDAHITYEDASFGPRPVTMGVASQYQIPAPGQENNNNPAMQDVIFFGGGPDWQEKGQKGYAIQNDFTFYGWQGHTLKAGFKYKQIDISALQRQPPNPRFRYDILRSFTVPYEVTFTATGIGTEGPVESDSKQFGVFLQDDWEINEHLTVNLGLRWDYEETPSFEDHVTPASLVAALRSYGPINNPNVDYDYNDFISTGNNRKAFKDAWQPRVGFSYDLFGDQRHVIFGGAGRAYNRNQFDFMAREQYSLAFQSYTYRFNTPGHNCSNAPATCLQWDPRYLDQAALDALVAANPNNGTTVYMIDNEIKTPYSDQFSLGMRNAFEMFGHGWNSSVTLLHILSHDGILFSKGNRLADGSFFPPGRSFGSPPPSNLPGFGQLLIGRNGVETRLTSLLLSLEKPYTTQSGWGATVAYTYSDAKENRNNHDTFTFDYPDLEDVAFMKSLGVPKHRLVATGMLDLGWGMNLSSKLTLSSPDARESLDCISIDTWNCYFNPYYADTTIGYKQLDMALQKVWDTGTDLQFRVRLDVLNVFDWNNWTGWDGNRGGGRNPANPNSVANPNPNFGKRSINNYDIAYPTRTVKLSFGLNW